LKPVKAIENNVKFILCFGNSIIKFKYEVLILKTSDWRIP